MRTFFANYIDGTYLIDGNYVIIDSGNDSISGFGIRYRGSEAINVFWDIWDLMNEKQISVQDAIRWILCPA